MPNLRKMLGIDVPIVLAPMGGTAGPELVAAVSNAGGLGILPIWKAGGDVRGGIGAVRGLTNKPFAVNLNNNYPQDVQLGAALDEGVGIVSLFWGINADHIARAKKAGAVVLQTVGTSADAKRAVDAGADVIVAQGWEAGGHVGSRVATLALVPAVVDAVAGTPVISAGGIADGRGVAAVFALGASAAWIGTRFLLADEATVTEENREKIISASEADTLFGKDENPEWYESEIRWIGKQTDRWSSDFWKKQQLAGQGVGLVRKRQRAAEIVAEVWADAQAVMAKLAGR
jgi:nitronate monooxygenase